MSTTMPPRNQARYPQRSALAMAHARSRKTTRSLFERWSEKVNVEGGSEACWHWTGSVHKNGYGSINSGGRGSGLYAHRVAWEMFRFPIPNRLFVCHRCDNRVCVNPGHMFLGNSRDNNLDAVAKGRHSPPPHMTGQAHGRSKLSALDVKEIRANPARGTALLAAQFGVSCSAIRHIRYGRNWKCLA